MKKILLLLFILFLGGCYNYKELNKIGIVSSISIDKKDNEYLVGAQVMNIKNKDDTTFSNVIVFESKGKTIEEALRRMTEKSDKKLYGGHLGKLVLSEEVSRESIIDVIDLFQRLPEIKDEFTITISKNIEANKVIKIMTSSGSIPADYVKSTIDSADLESALTYSSKLDEFVSYYLKKYIDPVVSVIEVKNYDDSSMKRYDNDRLLRGPEAESVSARPRTLRGIQSHYILYHNSQRITSANRKKPPEKKQAVFFRIRACSHKTGEKAIMTRLSRVL